MKHTPTTELIIADLVETLKAIVHTESISAVVEHLATEAIRKAEA